MNIINNQETSDQRGRIQFIDFQVELGPVGVYGFQIQVISNDTISAPKSDSFYA